MIQSECASALANTHEITVQESRKHSNKKRLRAKRRSVIGSDIAKGCELSDTNESPAIPRIDLFVYYVFALQLR